MSRSTPLDHLVDQFKDPLAFLRELVQNALDAQSEEVDITIEFTPGAGPTGVMVIAVDDFGEGMTRQIIDTKLTRLFSSDKDGDLTKIGKFGIGFASVFAIEPDAVCVDSGRGGESWRILFDADRRFSRIALDSPQDGTTVKVIKTIQADALQGWIERARQTVLHWCRHSKAEIRFQGTPINATLDLPDAVVRTRLEEPGTEIVVGLSTDGSSFAGFYNGGLTLLETTDADRPGLWFKISSRYLEHTLSRDSIIKDASYDKAMAMVDDLAKGALLDALVDALAEAVEGSEPGRTQSLGRLVASRVLGTSVEKRSAPKAVLRRVDGRTLTMGEARTLGKARKLAAARVVSPLTEALEAEGIAVVHGGALASAFQQAELPVANVRWCAPLIDDAPPPGWPRLRDGLKRVWGASEVAVAWFAYDGAGLVDAPAIVQKVPGGLTLTSKALVFDRKQTLVVNRDHSAFPALVSLATTEPELAAYQLIKLALVQTELTKAEDSRLAAAATEARCQRLGI